MGEEHGKTETGNKPGTCDKVRGTIRGLFEVDVRVRDFQWEIPVTSTAYQNFMK